MQTSGALGIYQFSSGALTWTTYDLLPNQALYANQEITSPDGKFILLMQSDGNLVESINGALVWATGTYNNPGAHVVMQGDGNLVVYSASGAVLWYSNTQGHAGAFLALQNDGSTNIYWQGSVIYTIG